MPGLAQGAGLAAGGEAVPRPAPLPPPERRIGRAAPHVNARVLVGALLTAVAALGTFAAYSGATADHTTAYVVAAHRLRPGQRLGPGDLATERMILPPALAGQRAFRDIGRLIGAVVVGPVAGGELVQASDVVRPSAARFDRELSFPIDPARAVDGTLQPGEVVEVLATYGTGSAAVTVVVVPAARVVAIDRAGDTFGSHPADNVTLGLDRPDDALALANAVDAGQVELVRAPAGDSGQSSYRTPVATGGG